MKKTLWTSGVLAGLFVIVAMLAPPPAEGMPGFARKYRLSCTTCHAPFPRLKAYGEEFAARGFRLEEEPARAFVDAGDPLLMLARDIPLGMRLEGFASFKEEADAEVDLEVPWTWKILSGGPLSEHASYYFYFLVERGEVVGLEDAYIQLNDIFGLPVTLMAGQFQICDPMFKREARLERADYQIYRTRVGESGLNLTYDRGVILGWTAPGEIEALLQIVNGNGIPHADEERNFDDDSNKNYALRLARGFEGGRVGVFGYYGVQEDEAGIDNGTWYVGPDVSVEIGPKFQANAQFLFRRDDNPLFDIDATRDVDTSGGFVELHYFPEGADGLWAVSGLYNKVDSDDDAADFESVSLTVNRLLARNLRVLVEGEYDVERERTRATVGLISAF